MLIFVKEIRNKKSLNFNIMKKLILILVIALNVYNVIGSENQLIKPNKKKPTTYIC